MSHFKRFKEAYTYINITMSDLVAVLVAGSATSVARGWGQLVYLPAELNSFDPDYPETQVSYSLLLGILRCRLQTYLRTD